MNKAINTAFVLLTDAASGAHAVTGARWTAGFLDCSTVHSLLDHATRVDISVAMSLVVLAEVVRSIAHIAVEIYRRH